MVNLDAARERLSAFLAAEANETTDATEYRGVRMEGAWMLTWDADVGGDAPLGEPSYLVLDDGSVHVLDWEESPQEALRRIRSER